MRRFLALATLASFSLACATPSPPATFAPACTSPQARALDFWLGRWEVAWQAADGRSGRATNSVVLEGGGCVVREHFRDLDGGLEGVGLYSFFAPVGGWTQTWMDNQGMTISAVGGPRDDPSESFELVLRRGGDPNRQYRIVFADVTPRSLTWRFQSRSGGADWTDETVSYYTRRDGER
jgi:hypothetical protein